MQDRPIVKPFVFKQVNIYFLTHFLKNGQKPSVFQGFLLERYEDIAASELEMKPLFGLPYAMPTKDHQTSKTSDVASIIILLHEFKWITTYVVKLRPCAAEKDSDEYLFLNSADTNIFGNNSKRRNNLKQKGEVFINCKMSCQSNKGR